jgi:oligopeptide transport system permease protein
VTTMPEESRSSPFRGPGSDDRRTAAHRPSEKEAKGAGTSRYAHYRQLYEEAKAVHGVSLWQDAWRRLKRNRVAMLSLGFLIVLALLAFLTPALPLQSPSQQDVRGRQFQGPSREPIHLQIEDSRKERKLLSELLREHQEKLVKAKESGDSSEMKSLQAAHPYRILWNNPGVITRRLIDLRMAIFGDWCLPSICGTDQLGRDVLARLFWGARVSLMVGITATFVSLLIGVSYGATAGYIGGTVDSVMMRIVDMLYSIPFLFVVILLITILSDEKIKRLYLEPYGINHIMIFYIVIGAIYWLTMSRVVRGQVITLKNEQFIDAARTAGASTGRIIFRHLIPNVLGIVIVYLTLTIPSVMLFEAILSFLGLGVRPPDVSWGLLADEGVKVITPIKTFWWLVLFPSAALALTLFALNFLGDGLRDAFDPRLKNR